MDIDDLNKIKSQLDNIDIDIKLYSCNYVGQK